MPSKTANNLYSDKLTVSSKIKILFTNNDTYDGLCKHNFFRVIEKLSFTQFSISSTVMNIHNSVFILTVWHLDKDFWISIPNRVPYTTENWNECWTSVTFIKSVFEFLPIHFVSHHKGQLHKLNERIEKIKSVNTKNNQNDCQE